MTLDETAGWTHDAFCDAIEAGDPFYLACPDGHGSVPPRRVCSQCGARSLTDRPLPDTGRVRAYTVVHVATPAFADNVPYVTAIADFGSVTLTGIITETAPDAIEQGTEVTVGIQRSDERQRPTLVFEPR